GAAVTADPEAGGGIAHWEKEPLQSGQPPSRPKRALRAIDHNKRASRRGRLLHASRDVLRGDGQGVTIRAARVVQSIVRNGNTPRGGTREVSPWPRARGANSASGKR